MLTICINLTGVGSNLLIGATGSIIATIIYKFYYDRKDKRKYGIIDGLFKSNSKGCYASIIYVSRNQLEIEVNEPNEDIWLGFITLYNEKNGSIDWNYIRPDDKINRYGLKKIIIIDKDNFKVIGDKQVGYGIELFTRLPIPKESTKEQIMRRLNS